MIGIPNSEDTGDLADWVEMSCLFPEVSYVSFSSVLTALEEESMPDPDGMLAAIGLEIERRESLTGAAYPVTIDRFGFVARGYWQDAIPYVFQLLLSTQALYKGNTDLSPDEWPRTAALFEKLTAAALRSYLPRGQVFTVGAPRRAEIETGFAKLVDFLATGAGEERGPIRTFSPHAGDEKLDIFAWVPMLDQRPGKIILIVQCAAGMNYKQKTTELSEGVWQDLIQWRVAPVRAFAFPFADRDDLEWRRMSRQGGVLLDRFRIASLSHPAITREETDRLLAWCTNQAAKLPSFHGY